MERMKCKACGCYSMVPVEVLLDGEEPPTAEQESRFFTCHVCGDNWLSVKETSHEGNAQVTFIHQMGMEPVLKRIAYLEGPPLVQDDRAEDWVYFIDDEEADEEAWFDRLADRRQMLKSICSN